MRQRGRKSAASLVTLPAVDGRPSRLQSPEYLIDTERSLFDALINACDPRHFVESDLPLLVSYVQATLLTRRAAAGMVDDPNLVAAFEKGVKLQATLATRLRLAPQARIDPKTLARQQTPGGPRPWELKPTWEPGE